MNIKKYFWELNENALRELPGVLKNPGHVKFLERTIALLSRCDVPKEVFSALPKDIFIEQWPRIKKYWTKHGYSRELCLWWDTFYHTFIEKNGKIIKMTGGSSETLMEIGKIIHNARITKDLSQKDLAERAALTQSDVSDIERGKSNITIQTLMRISKVLGLDTICLNIPQK
jgi:DNA-binding XRE family transcriptional regulator